METIEQLKEIVRTHSARKIEEVLIDVQTANAIVTVYEALGAENKEKFTNSSIEKMAHVAWKLVK